MTNEKTILIIWSWNSAGIGEGTWRVAGSVHAHDRVICRDWPVQADGNLQPLQALIGEITERGGDLMVFLHRHHGYHQAHVRSMLDAQAGEGKLQVFLFGEGADAIYLTGNPRGLLGTSGTFSAQVQAEERVLPLSAVADAERKMLKANHFEYVWEVYQLALRRRIYELKEDLFADLGRYLPRSTFEPGELYVLLNRPEHRLLFLRLLSFAGRIRKGSNLAKEIRTFERKTNRTLTFDDCGLQVESSYGASAAETYTQLSSYVLRHLLAKGEAVSPLALRDRFMELLSKIPGLVYSS